MLNTLLTIAIILLMLSFVLGWLIILIAIYFVPLIIAIIRKHNNIVAITILNVVLGWAPLGWLAALLWALNGDTEDNISDD